MVGLSLLQAAVQATKPLLSYRILEMGAGEQLVAFLPAALSIAPGIAAVTIGRLIDHRRPAVFAWVGAVGLAVGASTAALGPTVVAVFAGATIIGFGQILYAVAGQEIVAGEYPADAYDRGFALLAVTSSIGQIVGPSVGGFFASPGRAIGLASSPAAGGLVVAAALAVAGLAVLLYSLRSVRGRLQRDEPIDTTPQPGLFRNRELLLATIASLAAVSAIDILIVYMPVLGERYGMSPLVVGGLLSLRAASSIVSKTVAASARGTYDRLRWLVASLVIAAFGIAVLPFAVQRMPVLVVAVALFGLALGPAPSWTMAWVAEAVPSGRRATALAFRIAGNRFGQAIVPAVAGGLAGALGLGWIFAASSALLLGVASGIGIGHRGTGVAAVE